MASEYRQNLPASKRGASPSNEAAHCPPSHHLILTFSAATNHILTGVECLGAALLNLSGGPEVTR